MKRLTAIVFLTALLVPCLAAAQAMPHPPKADLGRWWKNSEIVRELGLSEAQTSQIEQTFLDQRLKLIDLRAELEKQEARLQPLVEADQLDEAKVSAQIDQVLAARGRLEKANTMLMLSIRRVLTVEQWRKLQAIKEARELGHRPPMPPGAPAPPRPPDDDSQ